MNAFIVRPFGEKLGTNFDKVEAELIQPALKAAGVTGRTTGQILEAGNIRADMFSELLTADLVIADISIQNANVFYELGVRQSLRDKRTFLIRCSINEVPFDVKTDRYLSYDAANPAASIENLTAGLKATLLSDKVDSPIFYMLPKLMAQDAERFLAVPFDFAEEVEIAKASRQTGKLALLAAEAEGFQWMIPGLRTVGEAQFMLRDHEDALHTWEKIRDRYPADTEANDRLATIYQRLAEGALKSDVATGREWLTQSDLAIKRLLNSYVALSKTKRAETFALQARNTKTRWMQAWEPLPPPDREKAALQSYYLKEAYEDYERGYGEDLNHYYPGINALALLTVMVLLAEKLPAVWESAYDTEEEAQIALKRYKQQQQKLIVLVQSSLNASRERTEREGRDDPWIRMTEADIACLTTTKPTRLGPLYEKAIAPLNDSGIDSAMRQLLLYRQLSILTDNVNAALTAFTNVPPPEADTKKNFLLFTGHMLDKPGRIEPRFPAEKEEAAKAAIKKAIENEKQKTSGVITGIAGGACGGDILFHEACNELGVPTELYLAVPRERFITESVQFAGPQWVERFDHIYKNRPHKILSATKSLPNWLQKKDDYSVWERNNLWMLYSSLVCGGPQMSLMALWNGKSGDGAGGTKHMVDEAQRRGSKTIIIDTQTL